VFIIRNNSGLAHSKKNAPIANEDIESPEVQLIGEDGKNRGIIRTRDALQEAIEADLDLILISPNANPPIAKILDIGRYKYAEQKRLAEARKKQKVVEVKEIQLRPNIDIHDYETKMKALKRFIEAGDRIKVTMRFRGRELAHQELGMQILLKVRDQTEAIAKVDAQPRSEGRQMVMMLSPK